MRITLEVVVASAADAVAAAAGGADRLELVAELSAGGIAPSADTIRAVRQATALPLYVMIRPRGGSFVYDPGEVATMAAQARMARDLGADGLVVGALTAAGAIDEETLRTVLQAGAVPATFHRAFDELSDKRSALLHLATLPYIERVLTSGGSGQPQAAIAMLRALIKQASGVEVMVGAGVTLGNAAAILGETEAQALHTATAVRDPQLPGAAVSAERVRQMRRILDGGV
ncbi:MAG: copper homeostasis protein [Firmicutes bacterium]|nr:copper homeostasis protein [Bacillota bacterium]